MATNTSHGIGALSRLTGVKIETIRYYEREDLIPSPPRTSGGHRAYGQAHVDRLTFISKARKLGFSVHDVRSLLAVVDGGAYTCGEVRDLTLQHADNVRAKIADLQRMERALRKISSRCKGGTMPECPIIDSLVSMEERS